MRKIGDNRYTQVYAIDDPDDKSKANHRYSIVNATYEGGEDPQFRVGVDFQRGPIKEAGVNGCHNEDLLVIVLDRLNAFQTSEFKCRENALAITKIEEALHWLNARTKARQDRGVEGTHTV